MWLAIYSFALWYVMYYLHTLFFLPQQHGLKWLLAVKIRIDMIKIMGSLTHEEPNMYLLLYSNQVTPISRTELGNDMSRMDFFFFKYQTLHMNSVQIRWFY